MKNAVIFFGALLVSGAAWAHDYTIGDLSIAHPYVPAPSAMAKAAGGYLTITNKGAAPDRLIGVETDAAKMAQLHTTETGADGVTKMIHLPEIEIPAGGEITLERGGMHVMLMGLHAPLEAGSRVPAILIFEKAGRVDVEFAVEAPSSAEGAKDPHAGHAGHGGH